MTHKKVTLEELKKMNGKEGLIFQGCGGSIEEWVDGVNTMFTDIGILLEGSKFKDVTSFENDNITCLLFPFDDSVKLDMRRLAIWRLTTYQIFGGTWLSDYVDNRLGGFITDKPNCQLIGEDGNIFNLMGIASNTLRENGQADKAQEMVQRIQDSANDYYGALNIISEYVNITSLYEDDEAEDWDEDMGAEMEW